MKHVRVISRVSCSVNAADTTAELVLAFMITILSGVGSLLTASEPLKEQQAKFQQDEGEIPDL